MLEPLHMTQCWPRDIINPLPPQVHPNTVLYTPCFSILFFSYYYLLPFSYLCICTKPCKALGYAEYWVTFRSLLYAVAIYTSKNFVCLAFNSLKLLHSTVLSVFCTVWMLGFVWVCLIVFSCSTWNNCFFFDTFPLCLSVLTWTSRNLQKQAEYELFPLVLTWIIERHSLVHCASIHRLSVKCLHTVTMHRP